MCLGSTPHALPQRVHVAAFLLSIHGCAGITVFNYSGGENTSQSRSVSMPKSERDNLQRVVFKEILRECDVLLYFTV